MKLIKLIMAPPTPVPCSATGCSFTAPLGAGMKEMLEFLKIHVQMAHPGQAATTVQVHAAKPTQAKQITFYSQVT